MNILVAGPPAAGKTTWVRERAAPGDLVLDWDEILAALSGLPAYERPEPLTYYANVAVMAVLKALRGAGRNGIARPPSSFVIRTAPKPLQREAYALPLPAGLGARVVVLATPADVCHARIDADPGRQPTAAAQHDAVDAWWRDYRPSRFDESG